MVWTGGSQGTLAPALVALFRQADALWPNRSGVSDGSIGDLAHASRSSDHNPKDPNPPGWVDAADITEDFDNGPNLPALWDHLIATQDPRVKYLIYEGRIVKSYRDSAGRPAWVPQPYTGLNAHRQHLHISVTPEGRADTSPWFPTEEDDMFSDDEKRQVLEGIGWLRAVEAENRENHNRLDGIDARLQIIARQVGAPVDVDEAEIARLVLSGISDTALSAEQVAGIVEVLPKAVADELAKRLAG